MQRIKKICWPVFQTLLLPAIVILAVASSVGAQDIGTEISQVHVDGNKVKGVDIEAILINIARIYEIPIGFISKQSKLPVSAADGRGLQYFPIEEDKIPTSASLREVLNELTAPDYMWKIDDATIIVYPIDGADIDIDRLLKAPVKDTELTFRRNFERVSSQNLQITNHLVSVEADEILVTDSSKCLKEFEVIRIDLKYKSVQEVLDLVLRESSYNFWKISKNVDGSTKELRIETR